MDESRSLPAADTAPEHVGGLLYGLSSVVGLIAVVVGVVMTICGGYPDFGVGLIVVGLPLGVAAGLGAIDPSTAVTSGRARAALVSGVALAVLFVSMAAGLAGVAGQLVRWFGPAEYVGWYGTKVTVALPKQCETSYYSMARNGAATGHVITCEHATWTLDGRQHDGTVTLADEDFPRDSNAAPASVEAYVLRGEGYSVARVGHVSRFGRWGPVPPWAAAGLLVAVILIVLLVRTGRVPRE
ncbi:hypothetical protein ACQP00_12605 [Dactylosporangium sp. CS-047395]|uniref:hypothetical protein n=1 Tax=Dactylosporangium sp. CS-047395 TaxID=3239936 RepID=UPI003D905556